MDNFKELIENYTYNGALSLKAIEDDIVMIENQIDSWNTALKFSRTNSNTTPLITRIRDAKKQVSRLKELKKRARQDIVPNIEAIDDMLSISANSAKEEGKITTAADGKKPLKQNFNSSIYETFIDKEDTKASQSEEVHNIPDIALISNISEMDNNLKYVRKEESKDVNYSFPTAEEIKPDKKIKAVSNENKKEHEEISIAKIESEKNMGMNRKIKIENESYDPRGMSIGNFTNIIDINLNKNKAITIPHINSETDKEITEETLNTLSETSSNTPHIEEIEENNKTNFAILKEMEKNDEIKVNEGKFLSNEFKPQKETVTDDDKFFFYMPDYREVHRWKYEEVEKSEDEFSESPIVSQEEWSKDNKLENIALSSHKEKNCEESPVSCKAFPEEQPKLTTFLYMQEMGGYYVPLSSSLYKLINFKEKTLRLSFKDIEDYNFFVAILNEWETSKNRWFGKKHRNIFMDIVIDKGTIKNTFCFEFKNCRIKDLEDSTYINPDDQHYWALTFRYKKLKVNVLD